MTDVSSRKHDAGNSLAGLIASRIEQKFHLDTDVEGLSLHRWTQPTAPVSYMLAPSICLIGQGSKRLFLGEEAFVYDADHFLITSLELPVVSQILEASEERPFVSLTMELDLRVISQLMVDHPPLDSVTPGDKLGVAVGQLTEPLKGAFTRLLSLLEQPQDIAALAPLIKQEIYYRLLQSDQGPRLRNLVTSGNHSYQISKVVDWLKANFSRPVKVEELAQHAGMSVSSFHSHFRAMTAMSPLQFQKKIRLNEARRLMLAGQVDASRAAYEVGYESPSQFSREYSRLFGAPPLKDIRQLSQDMGIN
ncbi:MAG: AraC family transcriptional regulator [Thalassolituus sp.]|nr:MAG: AraC family transcriptional regulator [Thalassolituus sp.]